VAPQPDASVQADTMFDVQVRANSLSYESKTNTFTTSAKKSLESLRQIGDQDLNELNREELAFLNSYVAAEVIAITPTNREHINPTFAFCKSLDMRSARVHASIGDGCFRSLEQFAQTSHVQRVMAERNVIVQELRLCLRRRTSRRIYVHISK